MSGSGISWATCKSAPRSRQTTMPAPHCSKFFTGRMPFLPPNQQHQRLKAQPLKALYISTYIWNISTKWKIKHKLQLLLLLHPLNSRFSTTTLVSRYQKGKTSLDLNEARDGVLGCSGISWTIRKQSAPRFRKTTTSTPHHSIFTVQARCSFRRPTNSVKALNAKCRTKSNSKAKHISNCE